MIHPFTASPRYARFAFAIAAVLATGLTVGAIDGLSQHYGSATHLASTPVQLAQR